LRGLKPCKSSKHWVFFGPHQRVSLGGDPRQYTQKAAILANRQIYWLKE
jgi:hypothetical protein